MKRIVLLGCIVLTMFMLAGSATAGSQIDTSNIYLMGYYRTGSMNVLSTVIQEFDVVTTSTEQYVEGTLTMWHNYYPGRYTGTPEFEVRNGVVTDIPFATNVTVRVKSDGWIVAWLTNEHDPSDIVFWNRIRSNYYRPSDTTLGQAIWRITDRLGVDYDKNNVNYYSYKYPDADRLLIGGRQSTAMENYYLLVPPVPTIYEMNFLWTSYLQDTTAFPNSCALKLNEEYIYNKNTTTTNYYPNFYEYAKYSQSISTDIQRDVRHIITIDCSGWGSSGQTLLKSAIAIFYKSE